MKYIITEEQYKKLNFLKRIIRRDSEIKNLISKYSKIPRTNYEMVLEMVVVDLINQLKIEAVDEDYRVIKKYIRKHYDELIKKGLKV